MAPPPVSKRDTSQPEPRIPNLRVHHLRQPQAPSHAWEVEGTLLRAKVRPEDLGEIEWEGRKIRLHVELSVPGRSWQLRQVSAATDDVVVQTDPKSHQVTVDFLAPTQCSLRSEARLPVSLEIVYETDDHKLHSETLDLDFKCLLGDSLLEKGPANSGAKSAAELATRYQADPQIQKWVHRAEHEGKLSLWHEVMRFHSWLSPVYMREAYTKNIMAKYSSAGIGEEPYALSPTELFRYGGDCEDHAMALGAYLTVLGYQARIMSRPHHVALEVIDPAKPEEGYVGVEMTKKPQGHETDYARAEEIFRADYTQDEGYSTAPIKRSNDLHHGP